jgi:hypothetical protein
VGVYSEPLTREPLPTARLPDYADEEEITGDARAADLALLADAIRHVRALVGALAELREDAELLTTGRYLDLVRNGVDDLSKWLDDAAGQFRAALTPAEEKAFRAEQAELHERLLRR